MECDEDVATSSSHSIITVMPMWCDPFEDAEVAHIGMRLDTIAEEEPTNESQRTKNCTRSQSLS